MKPAQLHARVASISWNSTGAVSSYSILAQHPRPTYRHAQSPRDTLATSSRRCQEDTMRKLLPWNLIDTDTSGCVVMPLAWQSLVASVEMRSAGPSIAIRHLHWSTYPVWPGDSLSRPQTFTDLNILSRLNTSN